MLRILLGIVATVAALLGIGWLGLRVPAAPYETPTDAPGLTERVPLADDLPIPVARYAEAVFGDNVPVVTSAVVVGRGRLRLNGLSLPARFRFYHDAGQAYYHDIQVTWFGRPVLTVDERYLNGVALMSVPGDLIEDEPNVNAAANQALWGEAIWLPSVWFTDERVQWEPIDENSARLIIPDAASEEQFTVYFDPQTHLLTHMETVRFQESGDITRTRWTNRAVEWGTFDGVQVPTVAETQWADELPWAVWQVERVLYNRDVTPRLAQFGGRVD